MKPNNPKKIKGWIHMVSVAEKSCYKKYKKTNGP